MSRSKEKHFGYKVNCQTNLVSSTDGRYGDGEWDYYSEEDWNNQIKGIHKCEKEDDYPDIVSLEDLEKGSTVFLVSVQYKTGGTFGHSTGNIEHVYPETDLEEAKKLAEIIKAGDFSNYSFSYKGVEIFACWEGYFESIEDILITPLILESTEELEKPVIGQSISYN